MNRCILDRQVVAGTQRQGPQPLLARGTLPAIIGLAILVAGAPTASALPSINLIRPEGALGVPATDATLAYEDWLLDLPDVLIDAEDRLDEYARSQGWADKVGWIEEDSLFNPDGGTGPWPAAAVLYRLGVENPEYERIANQVVVRELGLVHQIIKAFGSDTLRPRLVADLSAWDGGLPSPRGLMEGLDASAAQSFVERLLELLQDPQFTDLLYEAALGLPVLIEGAQHFSGDYPALTRVECALAAEGFLTAASAAVLAYAYVPELGGLEALGELIQRVIYYDFPLEGLGSGLAKYDFSLGQGLNKPAFEALGTAVTNALQEWVWNEDEQRYVSNHWGLPQLLEAVGFAFEFSNAEELKRRAGATFDFLSNNGGWTELYEQVDGASVLVGGVYEPWKTGASSDPADDYLNPYLSSVWLYQSASIKWFSILRASLTAEDREAARLHRERSLAMFGFLRRFMLNPDNAVMDHDLRIYVTDGPDGPIYEVTNRNDDWVPVGCMQCNFAVIRNFLDLKEILDPTRRLGG